MTVRVAQILLTLLILSLSPTISAVLRGIASIFFQPHQIDLSHLTGLIGALVLQAGLLVLLWMKTITWTQIRILLTIVIPLGISTACYTLYTSVLYARASSLPYEINWFFAVFPLYLQPACLFALWTNWSRAGFRATATATPHTRAVLCPKCNYDLSASHHTRCPECANERTLGQVLADATAPDPVDEPRSPDNP